MTRILITGGRGFVGQHLGRELVDNGHHVISVDRIDGDLRDPFIADELVKLHKPAVVVHLAAQVGRVLGEDDVFTTITTNALATARVAQAAARYGARLTYVSTSEVYGDQGSEWCREPGPFRLPHNLYGLTKHHGEEIAALYAPEGLQIIRLSMPYGPGLPAGRGRAAIVNLLHQAMYGKPMLVHRGAARCWCWIGDTVRGMRLVLEKGEQGRGPNDTPWGIGVYNIGRSDNEVTMHRVAQIACQIAGAPLSLIQQIEPPANQTVVKRLAMDKIHDLGWEPEVELGMGMNMLWEHVRHYDADGNIPAGPPPVVIGAPAAEGGAGAQA